MSTHPFAGIPNHEAAAEYMDRVEKELAKLREVVKIVKAVCEDLNHWGWTH